MTLSKAPSDLTAVSDLLDLERDDPEDPDDDLDLEDSDEVFGLDDEQEDFIASNSLNYATINFPLYLKLEKTIKVVKVKDIDKTLASKAKSVSINSEIIELPCFIYIPLSEADKRNYRFREYESSLSDFAFENTMNHARMIDVIKDDLFLEEYELEKICSVSENYSEIRGADGKSYLVIPDFQTYNLEFVPRDKNIFLDYESKNLNGATFIFNKKGIYALDSSQINNYKLKHNPESSSRYHKYEREHFISDIRYTVSIEYKDNDLDEEHIKALYNRCKEAEKSKKIAAKANPKVAKKPIAYARDFEDLFILLMEHQVDKLGVNLKGWTFHIGGRDGCIRKDCSEPMIEKILQKEDLQSLATFINKRRTNYKNTLSKFNWAKHPKVEELMGLM